MSGLAFQATLVCLLSEDPAQWCAVAELATRMAVAPDTVRMHLWQMQRAGLVELTAGLGATAVTAARIRPAAEARP